VWSSAVGQRVWLPVLALSAAGVWAWWLRRRWPLGTFCLFSSALVLLPTASLVPLTDAYVEHRLYLPIGFLAVFAVSGTSAVGCAVVRRGWASAHAVGTAGLAVGVGLLTTLGALTIARNRLYADPMRLYEDSVRTAPQNARLQFNLANAYARAGRRGEAIERYRRLIALDPVPPSYHVNLGMQYLKLGRTAEAAAAFEDARHRAPHWAMVHRNLTSAYLRLGRVVEAVTAAEEAARLEPLNTYGQKLLGNAYVRAGRIEDALRAYRAALFFDPNDADAKRRIRALGGTP